MDGWIRPQNSWDELAGPKGREKASRDMGVLADLPLRGTRARWIETPRFPVLTRWCLRIATSVELVFSGQTEERIQIRPVCKFPMLEPKDASRFGQASTSDELVARDVALSPEGRQAQEASHLDGRVQRA